MLKKPKFVDTEWFFIKPEGGWALKAGAPAAVRQEFQEYMRQMKEQEKMRAGKSTTTGRGKK